MSPAASNSKACLMTRTKQKSQSVSERTGTDISDQRVRRTRERIDAAFVELLHKRPYGRIHVSDITRKAHVGRPTFYAHYSGKDALLRSQFERIVAPMLSVGEDGAIDATALFRHVSAASQFYRTLMGADAGSAPRLLRQCFAERASMLMRSRGSERLEERVAAPFVASVLITIVESWLDGGAKEPPSELQSVFQKLTNANATAANRP